METEAEAQNTNQLVRKRILAFLADYLVIVGYALILVLLVWMINGNDVWQKEYTSPFRGQLIGFFTFTLPVFLYFFMMENSNRRATLGKLLLKIHVDLRHPHPGRRILIRNLLKFLPWEISHIGVHQIIFYSRNDLSIPIWIFLLLIIPEVIVLSYVFSMLWYKGRYTLYDIAAGTSIKSGS